jgi:endonuclease YncB( thermonuclease family)
MRFSIPLLAVGFLLTVSPVWGSDPVDDPLPGPVQGRVIRVIDGDTIRVRARIWLGQEVETNVRLRGVDAPEVHGKCDYERDLSQQATQLVERLVGDGGITLSDISYDKYGRRVVARIVTDTGQDLSQSLLRIGLGHTYDGGRKTPWCGPQQADIGDGR